jgi:hypothetical protein
MPYASGTSGRITRIPACEDPHTRGPLFRIPREDPLSATRPDAETIGANLFNGTFNGDLRGECFWENSP